MFGDYHAEIFSDLSYSAQAQRSGLLIYLIGHIEDVYSLTKRSYAKYTEHATTRD
jgi:hypothetical protein